MVTFVMSVQLFLIISSFDVRISRRSHPSSAGARGAASNLLLLSASAPGVVVDDEVVSNDTNDSVTGMTAVPSSSSSSSSSNTVSSSSSIPFGGEEDTAFDYVAGAVLTCLLESDKRRDAKAEHSNLVSSSATNWINDRTSLQVKQLLDKLEIEPPDRRTGINRDDAGSYLRWMKSTPSSTIIDLSNEFRRIANSALSDENLQLVDQTRTQFLDRMTCRLILLPSGTSIRRPLWEPPASLVYGKLLYGGVTRYRLLVSSNSSRKPPRKAGERTEIKSPPTISNNNNNLNEKGNAVASTTSTASTSTWIQYGGTQRMYEGVDIGPACVLEVVLLPRGQTLRGLDFSSSSNGNRNDRMDGGTSGVITTNGHVVDDNTNGESILSIDTDMIIRNFAWPPQDIFEMVTPTDDENNMSSNNAINNKYGAYTPISQSGKDRNDAFDNEFREAVGGLQPQIDAIVRRVLDGRVLRPVTTSDDDGNADSKSIEDETTMALTQATLEARELELLGLTPVRGLLLYGPPGTGKTLLARQIAKALRARAPKIVSAPELLDRWVGGSEKLVRQLFADAEAELASVNGDVTKSALHVIVIDEIDAVFRRRSAGEDSGEQTRASVVNQILSKLDGVNAIDNVLMVGMTNRRELLDEALLRPGRLEVQIEVPLPDREGRREILQIHFDALRRKGRLSRPLCCAIDGVPYSSSTSLSSPSSPAIESRSESKNSPPRKRDTFKKGISRLFRTVLRPYPDLAAETDSFSGADLAGLVRSAGSLALARARQDGSGLDGLLITLQDARDAIREVKV
jgi:vesicle-fusing ATPase